MKKSKDYMKGKRIAGSYATQKSPKKPKVMKYVKNVTEEEAAEYEKEKEELRLSLKIISGDDSEVNYEPLSRRICYFGNWKDKIARKCWMQKTYTEAKKKSTMAFELSKFIKSILKE
ncbi:hypothetical protein Tco_1440652 [Tanacetum coccineum]